jgi:stage III sporulation protein SpoIIIAA
MERRITDDIDKLLRVLPLSISYALEAHGNMDDLLEVVLDLGRLPTARYVDEEITLSDREITREDLDSMAERIGNFDADNRAGMERTLHRISAIRNRRDAVIGMTCRVGRAVYGTIDIIEELVLSGRSILLLGKPGVGKTTMLREVARVLAAEKRVVIVDTSNEIGGDGDVPHPAVGKARRMQVSHPEKQHEVMIEAVENHNPQVIIIDEIGREAEALAARTIAERGVQLIGTAHGNTLENLMLNPTLSDLVGGIQSVTLSDDEARRRGTQKTVLERRSPPTFDVLVELQTRDRMAVHESVTNAVDGILSGRTLPVEIRARDSKGNIVKHHEALVLETRMAKNSTREPQIRMVKGNRGESYDPNQRQGRNGKNSPRHVNAIPGSNGNGHAGGLVNGSTNHIPDMSVVRDDLTPLTVYAYGVARNRLFQAAKRLHVPLTVVEDFGDANAVVTLKNYYRRRPKLIADAERRGMPIYVLRANTVSQMENFLVDVFKLEDRDHDPFGEAMLEAEQAIMRVRAGEDFIDLQPQASHIRKRQHALARKAQLQSRSYGAEGSRHVRILNE